MEKPAPGRKVGVELDKFKRRLIRSVARLLLQEKKQEEEIWKELKKETGCDHCELLWTRMRALTLKKLERLLSADDRMNAVPRPARMSPTDWLLFDLVLVHQKIDLIGQNMSKTKDFPALVELFELVKTFNVENLSGEQLAEAWSLATFSYNNAGHHCSPMLLQRRWYQLKEVTRVKFYEYWYAYRGSFQRISVSEPFKPSPLQTDIARTFKQLITKPLESWEELINTRKVTMPDEFQRYMKERFKKPSQEESTLPQIGSVFGNVNDTSVLANIDENNVFSNAENTEVSGNDIDSNVVNVGHAYTGNNKTSVEVSDTIVLDDVEDSARRNEKETGANDNLDESSFRNNDEVIELSDKDKDADSINDTIEEICENVGETSPADGDNINVPGGVNVISDDDDNNLGVVDSSPISKPTTEEANFNDFTVCKTSVTGNITETTVTGSVEVYKTCVNDNVKVANESIPSQDVAILDAPTTSTAVTDSPSKNVEVIDTAPNPVVIINSDDEGDDMVDNLLKSVTKSTVGDIVKSRTIDQPMEVDPTPEVLSSPEPLKVGLTDNAVIAEEKEDRDVNPNVPGFNFGELPTDISFVDDGIEVVDDGIIYADDDGLNGPNIKREAEDKDTPKIDAKLLMCPIVYTTRLDDMYSFHRRPFYHIKDKHLIEDITKKSKPIKREPKETVENVTVNYDTPKIDAKLLMCPIVYTTRLDDMYSFHRRPFCHINMIKDKHLIEDITKKSKPIKREPKETVENVTVNYVGENIESVTVNTKTVEHAQKSVTSIEKVSINNDSIVIIKKEPVNVNSETSADVEPPSALVSLLTNNPENNESVISDDDDSHENVIDESQKVKPTSYLLQKPRSHRYNLIQLCKNPDFNTRLKRLSVGFFSSPRNRVLIKSCKPLTIDLSKTFESKLVSGTLYLKPFDHNVFTEIRDDTESQNVSVLPSAMPAQSLIDNSKATDILPMLRQCLEASKQSQELGTTTERNKVINLPDITEIRRINQRLLNAEVTPIQVHNNQAQVPVTIVSSLNTPTCTAQKTVTIPEPEQDLRPRVTEANDARGPPKLLDIIDDSPANSSIDRYPTTTVSTHTNNTYTSTERNTFDTFRPQAPGQVAGRPPRMINGKRVFPQKLPVWKPRQFRPEVPWLNRANEVRVDSMMNETLLTMDALNKMLFLLTKEKEFDDLEKKLKSKVKRKHVATNPLTKQARERAKTKPNNPSVLLVPAKEDEASENTQKTCADTHTPKKLSQKPKINIRAATNYPPDKGKSGNDPSKKKIKYCCWARQRMLQLLFCRATIPVHECPRLCTCCCLHLLADYITQDKKIKDAEMEKTRAAENAFGVTKENIECEDSACSSGSFVGCTQTNEDTPAVYVDATNTTKTIIENETICIDVTENDVPALGGEVSVKTTPVDLCAPRGISAPVTVRGTVVAVPFGNNRHRVYQTTQTRCNSPDEQSGGIISIMPNATKIPSLTAVPNISSPPSISQFLEARTLKAPFKYSKKSIPIPPLFNKINKPFMPPKNFKEKMIFLNSKQSSEKPTASPVFLGKNKLLLTSVKFPPNLRLFEESKMALRHSLNLPNGVHLVLQADGTISYIIDHNVEVNAMDMAELPAIIATVQGHMDTQVAQKKALVPVAMENEVVDLVDDDDESDSNANEHQNTATPPVSEVQPTEENVTKNSDDSPDVNYYSKMDTSTEPEENTAAENIKSNVIDPATESNQNETADQCSVTDNQEDIQDSSQNEIVSASTEQVQPDPSIEKVSAEIDYQPKPSSPAESSDVHEGSAEQVQDQPMPSGQNVSIGVQDHPDPITQNVRTELPEESRSEPSKPKTKNRLSDLMEMSGIFDEDITPEENVSAKTVNSVPPTVSSPLGELTPITSLYELKYACANKGAFFKLDFETGFLLPINVCMKPGVTKPPPPAITKIAPKSVIDLTDDDDKQETKDKQLDISPTKRSLLLVNNSPPGGFAGPVKTGGFVGPVKPVKLFKGLKPSILKPFV